MVIISLGNLYEAIKRWTEEGEDHPYALNFDETLVFFDTETTGLKGVGTHIFLLGLLEAQEERVCVNAICTCRSIK